MHKNYIHPKVIPVHALPEPTWRCLLANILLEQPQFQENWMYHTALETLFTAECACALKTLSEMRKSCLQPQLYLVDIGQLVSSQLFAAKRLLNANGYTVFIETKGNDTPSAIYPRYLTLAIIQLLRTAAQTSSSIHVFVDIPAFSVCIQGKFNTASLALPRAVAAAHGGRVLQTDDTAILHFSPLKQNVAYPCQPLTSVDDILQNPLSAVNAAFSHLAPLRQNR